MIELLLVAEHLLADGDLDRAEHLFAQVADADPRNAIAVVGLARIARARGDDDAAADLVRRALAIDPDEAAARRLLAELETVAAPAAEPALPQAPATAGRRSLLGWIRALLGFGD
ncbi:MAG: tetratricopeptide repeat protein [Candidatus Limnocylindrales bacterium]